MFTEILSVVLYLLLVSIFIVDTDYPFLMACLAAFLYLLIKRDKIRLVFPFFIPFLLMFLIPSWIVLGAMVLFFPFLLVQCWGCTPLLNDRLEALAKKAKFSHAGFKVWNTSGLTAAIVGAVPFLRYVLLSKPLIFRLSPDALDAVVAHEIGHSKNNHLIWGPLILSGCLIPLLAIDSISIPFFIFYVIFVLLYFRYVFGFYSRLFEREADLYGLKLGIPLKSMQEALDQVGNAGFTHHIPSWHHFSLYERIEYLKAVEMSPALEKEHTRRVKFWKWIYIL